FLRELIVLFLECLPEMLQEIEDAAAVGDFSRIMRSAHKLKGSISPFYASRLHDLALKVENKGRACESSGLSDDLFNLRKEAERLRRAMETYVHSGSSLVSGST
ncbi:MAG: Hpt domain-containing protein, partial [Gemmataceae bacterium]